MPCLALECNFSSVPHKNPMNPWMKEETEEQSMRDFTQGYPARK